MNDIPRFAMPCNVFNVAEAQQERLTTDGTVQQWRGD